MGKADMCPRDMTGTKRALPPTFTLAFRKAKCCEFVLTASQVVPLSLESTFSFFENPGNLFEITPDWLDFRLCERDLPGVFEGAVYNYTIRWFGIRIRWQSKITEYTPPQRFVDVQVRGPYRYWHHLHTFDETSSGTVVADRVTYRVPFFVMPLHHLVIKKQLEDIFSYRAARIAQWASGMLVRQKHR
ncbi:MAG: SRPBCC family protein [Chloroflexota bacterium]